MNIIENIATRISELNMRKPRPHLEVLEIVKSRINDIDNKNDKIKFLSICLKNTTSFYEQHLLQCTNPEVCERNYHYDAIIYYLQQELQRLGIILNEDIFTDKEIELSHNRIDELQNQLSKLEIGQEVVFDNIEELKDLYYLGKKKWYQLLLGKLHEMTLSGIISETLSKGFIELFKTGSKTIGINF